MGIPFQRRVPGDPGAASLPARDWNAAMEVAEWFRRAKLGSQPGGGPPYPAVPANLVLVRNDTGGDLPVFSVLTPDPADIPIDPTDGTAEYLAVGRKPILAGIAPTADTQQPLILIEPVPDGLFGFAAAAGVVACEIDVTDSGHGWAACGATTARLTSGTHGPARVLWKDTGTGYKKAVVLLAAADGDAGTTCVPYVHSVSCVAGVLTVTTKYLKIPDWLGITVHTDSDCDP